MEVNTTTGPAARSRAEVLADVRRATCGHCWAFPGEPCVIGPRGTPGYHVARLSRAMRRGLITGPELIAALRTGLPFTNATVIRTDGAASAAWMTRRPGLRSWPG